MRIGINLLYLLPGIVGGTETYAAGLLYGLATVSANEEFLVYLNQEAAEWPLPERSNIKRIVCPINGASRATRYYYEQIIFPKILRDHKVDLIHSLGYVGPIKTHCPSVLTIHDANYMDLANAIPLQRRFVYRIFVKMSARTAKHIITDSMYSKERICQTMDVNAGKISVIYLAPRLEMSSESKGKWAEIKNKYGLYDPYIAVFGGGSIHKNIPRLIEAFEVVSRKINYTLVIVGNLPPDLNMNVLQCRDKNLSIITTGYVSNAEIPHIISHADLFVIPSLYEGFGLPVLEAQQVCVAIACSRAGSLPEVAGEGALFFNPFSVDEMVNVMERILCNKEVREVLKQRGMQNRKRFSWELTALKTRDIYYRVLSNNDETMKEQQYY